MSAVEKKVPLLAVVFFLTLGFVGLEAIIMELVDPFGMYKANCHIATLNLIYIYANYLTRNHRVFILCSSSRNVRK